ncbi:MAG: hypothetical protein ABI912_00060 [Actinomycetota bacterium]
MCGIEVQVESLADVGRRLTLAAQVAGDIEKLWAAPDLLAGARDCGDEQFAGAIARFLLTWGYGCAALHADAKTLAGLLRRAGAIYLDVESAIAAGAP